ncbi:MAG: hypothetical protein GC201_10675 [Alphaproteobacteria bacterium]|nr:hypothetical protein [Alphaproteobacteria bacterium]
MTTRPGRRSRWRQLLDVLAMEHVTICMRGGREVRALFEEVSSPHPKLRIVARQGLGASLLRLSGRAEPFLEGGRFADARRKARRAEKAGYVVQSIEALRHVEAIVAIHRSAATRQGRPVWQVIMTPEGVSEVYAGRRGNGIFDTEGRLRGYVFWEEAGEAVILRGLMGHAASLADGIMYLLLARTIDQAISHGGAVWLQYGVGLGDSEGMRRFKQELGFAPYRVTWRWDNRLAASVRGATAADPLPGARRVASP